MTQPNIIEQESPASWSPKAPPLITIEEILDELAIMRDFASNVASAPAWLDDIWLSSDPETQTYRLETFINARPGIDEGALLHLFGLMHAAKNPVSFDDRPVCITASITIPATADKKHIAEITHAFVKGVEQLINIGTAAGIVRVPIGRHSATNQNQAGSGQIQTPTHG